jgi:hypothetical protein
MLVTKNILPDKKILTMILSRIHYYAKYMFNNININHFSPFIYDIYYRGFQFDSTHYNFLSKIGYYIDPKTILSTNRKICNKMFRFLFSEMDSSNLSDIKSIMEKYNLSLNEKCLNNMLYNFKEKQNNTFIQYINFFATNNYIFNDDNIIQILNKNMISKKQQNLLNIICNGKITDNIIIKLFCDNKHSNKYENILSNYYQNNMKNTKIQLNKNTFKKIIIYIAHNIQYGYGYKYDGLPIIKLLLDMTDFIIDYDIMEFIKMDELLFDKSIIQLFESKNESLKEIQPIITLESEFITYMQKQDIDNVKRMIDNKFIPKVEHLYHLYQQYPYDTKKSSEIIKLFINYLGITIDDELYSYLNITGISKLNDDDFPDVSLKCKNNIKFIKNKKQNIKYVKII